MILARVGCCIYCGKEGSEKNPLTAEHIIPYGLKGYYVLSEASCTDCAAITSKFEKDVLRLTLGQARALLDYPTRRRKNRPKKFPLAVKIDGIEKKILLPPNEYPIRLCLLEFKAPAYFDKQTPVVGITCTANWEAHIGGLTIERLQEKYGFQEAKQSITWRPDSFARLLAKIAYGFTVACFGLENVEENYVLPYIMGEKFDGISNWVGGAEEIIPEIEGGKSLREMFDGISNCIGETEKKQIVDEKSPHDINIYVSNRMEVLVRLKLLAQYGPPDYLVLVGRLKNVLNS